MIESSVPETQRVSEVRISTAAFLVAMFDDTPRDFSADPSLRRFDTGMNYRWLNVPHDNEQQGQTTAIIAGSGEDWHQLQFGPLVRMDSACAYSKVGHDTILTWLLHDRTNETPVIVNAVPSKECDCWAQGVAAMKLMSKEGGIFFDLADQEARNAGAETYKERLEIKSKIYKLMASEGITTFAACERLGVPIDTRDYRHCARLLKELGLSQIRLLSNNPEKIRQLTESGIAVTAIEHVPEVTVENISYLESKQAFGHLISGKLRIFE